MNRSMPCPRWSGVLIGMTVTAILVACEDPLNSSVTGSVSVTPIVQTVSVGSTAKIYATGSSSRGNDYVLGDVTWSSSDESVAVIIGSRTSDVLGLGTQMEATVSGLSPGTVQITAVTERAGNASATVTVNPSGAAGSLRPPP